MTNGELRVPEKERKMVPMKFCPKCGSTDVFWAGVASALVALAVQILWVLRTCDLGGWKTSKFASRELESKEQTRKSIVTVASALIPQYLVRLSIHLLFSVHVQVIMY